MHTMKKKQAYVPEESGRSDSLSLQYHPFDDIEKNGSSHATL